MNINWKVRLKNPVFWGQIIAAIFLPLIVGAGFAWSEMTSWAKLFDTLLAAINNPVVVVSMVCSVWAAINDPTTAGLRDSELAMTYDKPKGG